MPKVKMRQAFTGAISGNYNPRAGDVLDVSAATAHDLVANGYASPVAEKKKTARKKPTLEAATASPPEAAMRKKAQPRDG